MEKSFLHNFDRSVLRDFVNGNLHKFNVKNVQNVEISLDNDLKVIQDHLNISTYYSQDYLNKVDDKKIKMQLWIEENINNLDNKVVEYNQDYNRQIKSQKNKYNLDIRNKKFNIKVQDDHEQDVEYQITIIFILISSVNEVDITKLRFHKKIAQNYIYSRIFYKNLKKGELLSFEDFLKRNDITDPVKIKYGIYLSKSFYTLELISDITKMNNEKEGTPKSQFFYFLLFCFLFFQPRLKERKNNEQYTSS